MRHTLFILWINHGEAISYNLKDLPLTAGKRGRERSGVSVTHSTDLANHIANTPLCDTHEHLNSQKDWVEKGPDILQDLFGHYPSGDLASAGATEEAMKALLDGDNKDIAARFEGIRGAWEAVMHTGYGEAVRILAQDIYGMDELTPQGLEAANETLRAMQKPGQRLALLKEKAGLDHVQIDNFSRPCRPDPEDLQFFLYDLSWSSFCRGYIEVEQLHKETGITVKDLNSLDEAMQAVFARFGPLAIAIKSQHAYQRTLKWKRRSISDVKAALTRVLAGDNSATIEDRLCLGDWCTARGVELSIEYNLPVKLHTGYYAGHDHMPMERIRPGHLSELLLAYPKGRFVLMHTGYPYIGESLALAKHFSNVWIDLCWAWSIDPYTTRSFVRRFIHTAPANKLFAFGGDTFWPTSTVAYAHQARRRLTQALQAEVDDGEMTEKEAMRLATMFMRENQYAFFDMDGTRRAIAEAAKEAVS